MSNLKKSWGQSSKDFKEGFIYCIKNEAWPGFTKVGITYDINNRLNTYQTGDPFRSYKIAYYDFVLDRKQTERDIFSKFKINIHNGEWLNKVKTDDILNFVRTELNDYTQFGDKMKLERSNSY